MITRRIVGGSAPPGMIAGYYPIFKRGMKALVGSAKVTTLPSCRVGEADTGRKDEGSEK